tara:strand:+ start:9582 stop:10748 length:1167 start_codon:yes stop_codon:yes gene_type:complete
MKTRTRVSERTRLGTTIFRRTEKGTWSYATKRNGKHYLFPLGYDLDEAKKEADRIRGMLMVEDPEVVRKQFCRKIMSRKNLPIPTIGEVLDVIRESKNVKDWKVSTVRDYVGAVGSIPRVALNTPREKVLNMPADILTPELIETYKERKLDGIVDQGHRKSVMRTINGNIRALKAVFSPGMELRFKHYDISWAMPLRDEGFYGGLKKYYKFPPSEMVTAVFDLCETLEGDEKTALSLALYFGLRRGEIYHCRRAWFDTRNSMCRLDIAAELDFTPKGGHEGMTVGDEARGKKILNEAVGEDYLLGYRKDNGRKLFEGIIKKLHSVGFTVENGRPLPMHEMRKLFGSYIATTQSLYVAQKYLRHADASTTDEAYADLIVDKDVLQMWAA